MVRRVLIAGGVIAMVAGLAGAIFEPGAGLGAFLFLAAVLVLHDGVFLPLIGLFGRRVPVAAGVVGVSVAVVGVPLAHGLGRGVDDPYSWNLILILALVVLFGIGKRMVRSRRRPREVRRE